MYGKILVAIDGSEPSLRALAHGVDLSLELGSELTVLSVVSEMRFPFSAEYGLWAAESHEELTRRVLESLDAAILRIREEHPELKVEARIEDGRPAMRIVEVAEREGFDLIIVGRRGNGLVDRLVMGSVSNEVVRTSTKPVLVVE